ncbi:MAG: peptide deformylase [Gemmatimonadetes bacterium]|nr:peptide deformylase [Gemmatimonadota bacterium]
MWRPPDSAWYATPTRRELAELTIVTLGAPILRQRAEEVGEVDDEVRLLVRRMFATMYASEGQGLAAPQVDVSWRIAVVDVPPGKGTAYTLINPRVVVAGETLVRGVEGCLSVPGVTDVVERPAEVVVEALDINGEPFRLEADGELARCVQHEIDHLDGVLFIDHLSPLARRMLLGRYRKQQQTADK